MVSREGFLQGAKKVLGGIGRVAMRVGQAGLSAARFAAQNHQPIAFLAKSFGDATGNPTMQGIGNAALMTSGFLTGIGYGHDNYNIGGNR